MLPFLVKSVCINGRAAVFTARLSSKVNLVATATNRGTVAVRGYADKPTTPVGKEPSQSAASMGTSTASRSPAASTAATTSPSTPSAKISDSKSFNITSAQRQIAIGGIIVLAALIAYVNWPAGKPKDV